MIFNRFTVLKALFRFPLIGKVAEKKYCEEMLLELERFEARFFSSTVRFVDQIHDLYDCLERSTVSFNDDYNYVDGLVPKLHTRSSGRISTCLAKVFNNEIELLEVYFKTPDQSTQERFTKWYSNDPSTNYFLNSSLLLMGVYCHRNPRDEDGVVHDDQKQLPWNPAIKHFITSPYFKLVVMDVISVMKVALDVRLWRLNGK